jgi:hypothetical protein
LVSDLEDLYVHEEPLPAPVPGHREHPSDVKRDMKVIQLDKTRKKLEEWFRQRDIPIRIVYTATDIRTDLRKGHGIILPNVTPIGKKGVITYAYLPVGSDQEPPTAWMVVHNLSHALFEPRHYYDESPYEVFKSNSLSVEGVRFPERWEKQYNLMGKDPKRPALYPTTRSQQLGKIKERGEGFHELFTQWVVKGQVILNPRNPKLEKDLDYKFRTYIDDAAEEGAVVYNL